MIYRYYSDRKPTYNGLRIEVQIRSGMQHAWATAVETVGTMLRQSLKASQGEEDWLRFFTLMGTWMAAREGTSPVGETPEDPAVLRAELRVIAGRLDVVNRLQTYARVVRLVEEPAIRGRAEFTYFLITLDPTSGEVRVVPYGQRNLKEATDEYARVEQEVSKRAGGEAVLVAVEQLGVLRKAYPNYFLDTSAFLEEVSTAIAKPV